MPNLAEPSRVGRVEVLRVARDWAYWGEWSTVPGVMLATVVGAEAQELLALVAGLPDAMRAACFFPRYGLRAWGDDGILAEAAICYECSNGIVATPDGQHDWFGFAPKSEPGQSLLRELTRHDPDPGARSGQL